MVSCSSSTSDTRRVILDTNPVMSHVTDFVTDIDHSLTIHFTSHNKAIVKGVPGIVLWLVLFTTIAVHCMLLILVIDECKKKNGYTYIGIPVLQRYPNYIYKLTISITIKEIE